MNQRRTLYRLSIYEDKIFSNWFVIPHLILRNEAIKSVFVTLARQSSSATTVAFDNPARLRTKTD